MSGQTYLSDIFFVIGVFLTALSGLRIISSKGGFTGLGYIWYWVTDGITKRNVSGSRKDYYTFQKEFLEKKRNSNQIFEKVKIVSLGIGILCILISLIIALMLGK